MKNKRKENLCTSKENNWQKSLVQETSRSRYKQRKNKEKQRKTKKNKESKQNKQKKGLLEENMGKTKLLGKLKRDIPKLKRNHGVYFV